jgi:hypothetical protein
MAITNGYCTLAEFKLYAKITSTDTNDDAVIEDIIEGISRQVDLYTGRTFYARTETHYYNTPETSDLLIEDDDLLTITTLTNGDTSVITSASYKLYPLNSSPKYKIQLLPTSGISWESSVAGDSESAITLVGSWGYSATAPENVRQACLIASDSDYHSRFGENMSGTATITGAGVVITPKGLPKSAMEKIEKYVRLV